MRSISVESPEQGSIRFSWKKSIAALLRYFISSLSNPILLVAMYLGRLSILTAIAVRMYLHQKIEKVHGTFGLDCNQQ